MRQLPVKDIQEIPYESVLLNNWQEISDFFTLVSLWCDIEILPKGYFMYQVTRSNNLYAEIYGYRF